MKKILILGASGMLGHTFFNYFMLNDSFEVYGTVRKNPNKNQFQFNFKLEKDLKKLLKKEKFDYIINCIGELRKDDTGNFSINYEIPFILDRLSRESGYRLIHISTDDVFNPLDKKLDENSIPNPVSEYGKSKLKGETTSINSLTIRTSIIGHSLSKKGLLDWLISNKNGKISGYENQIWKGCTTLQLVKFCEEIINKNTFEQIRSASSFIHYFPLGPITKYSLLNKITKQLDLKIKIAKTNSKQTINREITSRIIKIASKDTDINNALADLEDFEIKTTERILVTGGAGYIGSALVKLLLNNNKQVVVLDNFTFKNINIFEKNKNLKIIEGDVTNIYDVKSAMQNITKVVHLAGIVGDPACSINPKFTKKVNIEGTRILIKESIKQNISNFIFASSCSVYGFTKNIATEKTKPNPVSLYSETKIVSENDLLKIKNKNFHPTILRFSTIFGLSNRPRFDLAANIFTATAYYDHKIFVNNGDQWRPFIHVNDVARAIYLILESDTKKIDRKIFNVGDDRMVITISSLAKKIKKLYSPQSVEIIKSTSSTDPRNYRVSFTRINSNFGFKKDISFESGILEMIKFFKSNKKFNYKHKKYSNVESLRKKLS